MLQTSFCADSRVFSGRKCLPIYNPGASLGHLLFGNFLSKRENCVRVQKWLKVLQRQVNPGDVVNSIVAGLAADDEELIDVYVAALINGNPIHFLDHRSGKVEIENAVQVTNAKTVVVEGEEVQEEEAEVDGDCDKPFCLKNFQNPSPVAFFSTAGVCGLPKLVPLSAESIIHHLSNPLNTSSVALAFQPLSKYRIFLEALMKLVKGSRMRIRTEFSLQTFQEECFSAPFEELHLTNYQLAKIVDHFKFPVKFVRHIYCSGCYANPILIRRAKTVFPNAKIVYSYGLTEFGTPVAINPDAGAKYTVGQLNDNFEVCLRDERGENMGVGCQGQIFVRAPVPFEGYYKDPEDTMGTITLAGWCRTGDIGYFDEDLDLHILDREKAVIVYDCNVISPLELEFYLRKMPGVREAKVFGVPHKEKGELAAAKIVREKGATFTGDQVNEFMISQLGPLKALHGGVMFIEKW